MRPYPFSLLQDWFKTTLEIENDPLIVNFYIKKAEAAGMISQTKTPEGAEGVHFKIPDRVLFLAWTRLVSRSRGNT